MRVTRTTCLLPACLALLSAPASAATCEELRRLPIPRTEVTSAQVVAAGSFAPEGQTASMPVLYRSLPAFCRVTGVLRPSAGSHIEFEVWLPAAGWNGKYQGVGNGGFAGYINYENLASALVVGYAASSTDTGHQSASGVDAQWTLGHPDKLVDYGHRAIHETAVASKAIIRGFYGEPPRHSYFSGCSNGGRQALMAAQRYPEDYDGIIAGAPAANFSRIIALFSANTLAMTGNPASHIPPAKFAAVEKGVLAACDARDGASDGIVADPPSCRIEPAKLRCSDGDQAGCLTPPQLATLERLYAGLQSSGGQQLYPGFAPGGESGPGGWGLWMAGPTPGGSLQHAFSTQANRFMVFENATYDYRTFNVDRDVEVTDSRLAAPLNATSPDLRAFSRRGGKLILYHGWADAALPPAATIDYYQAVASTIGQKDTDGFVRLYMVPGMQHCGGGPGPDSFGATPGLAPREPDPSRNMSAALERWVERGIPPGSIVATKYKTAAASAGTISAGPDDVILTRPLCAYPLVAKPKGAGRLTDAENFACVAP